MIGRGRLELGVYQRDREAGNVNRVEIDEETEINHEIPVVPIRNLDRIASRVM